MIVLLYEIDTDDASAALNIASEIESEMGIQPKTIVLPDGRHIRYNRAGSKALKNQQKTIDKYISENLTHGY